MIIDKQFHYYFMIWLNRNNIRKSFICSEIPFIIINFVQVLLCKICRLDFIYYRTIKKTNYYKHQAKNLIYERQIK